MKKFFLILFFIVWPSLSWGDENWHVDCTQNNVCLLRSIQADSISRVAIGVAETESEKLWFINAFYPTEISLPRGVGFQIDENAIVELTLQSCNSKSCRASGALDVIALQQMKAGEELFLVYTKADVETTTRISYSLAGFGENFNRFILELVK